MANAESEDCMTLAEFDRRNQKSGAPEKLRLTTGSFKGRQLTHVRIYFLGYKPKDGDEDPWRPTQQGATIREWEIDEVIAALEAVRKVVHSEGRTTCPAAPGHRNPRPRQVEREERYLEPPPGMGDEEWRASLPPKVREVHGAIEANRAKAGLPAYKPMDERKRPYPPGLPAKKFEEAWKTVRGTMPPDVRQGTFEDDKAGEQDRTTPPWEVGPAPAVQQDAFDEFADYRK